MYLKFQLELYLKFKFPADGDLLLIKNTLNNYMLIQIVNNIIKLKVKLDDYFDETSIKIEEIDSSWIHLDIEQQVNVYSISVNGEKRTLIMSADISNELCKNNFYIGNSEVNILLLILLNKLCILQCNTTKCMFYYD